MCAPYHVCVSYGMRPGNCGGSVSLCVLIAGPPTDGSLMIDVLLLAEASVHTVQQIRESIALWKMHFKKHKVMHAPMEAPTHRGRPFVHRQHSVLLFHLQWKNLTCDPEHFQCRERGCQGMPCMSASKMRGGIDRYPSFVLFSCLQCEGVLIGNCLLNLEKELRIVLFQRLLSHKELNVSSFGSLFSYGFYDPRV